MVAVDVLVVDHPLARSRLTVLRDERTDSGTFRFALHELTTMLVYEATRNIAVERYQVQTPVEVAEGVRVANPPLLVPVLRAGLGMSDAALALLPDADVVILRTPAARVVVRPSGTEPKLKAYLEVVEPPAEDLPAARERAAACLVALRTEVAAALGV